MLEFIKQYTSFISFLWGLALAVLFRKTCDNNNCVVIKGLPIKYIDDKFFKMDNNCYKFKPYATKCN